METHGYAPRVKVVEPTVQRSASTLSRMISATPSIHPLLRVQQTAGNRAVQGFLQAKMAVSQAGDPDEREADEVAERIVEMPDAPMGQHRMAARGDIAGSDSEGAEDRKTRPSLQLKGKSAGSHHDSSATPSVSKALGTHGHPLDSSTRSFMESRFEADFSQVRVHTDKHAAESADALQADAYATGSDVYFAANMYAPGTGSGRHLLAHELVHVLQQERSGGLALQRRKRRKKPDESPVAGMTSAESPMSVTAPAPEQTPGFSHLPPASQPTVIYHGVEFTEDPTFIRSQLIHQFLARSPDGTDEANQFQARMTTASYNPELRGFMFEGIPTDQTFDRQALANRVAFKVGDVLKEIERENKAFLADFEVEARVVLGRMLDKSAQTLGDLRGKFSSSSPQTHQVAADAAALVTLHREAEVRTFAVKQAVQDRLQQGLMSFEESKAFQRRYAEIKDSYEKERSRILKRNPLLADYLPEQNLKFHLPTPELEGISTGTPEGFAPILAKIADELAKINKVKEELRPGGGINVWRMPPVIEATQRLLGIPREGMRGQVLVYRMRHPGAESSWSAIALGLLQFTLYALAPFTGGLSLIPAAGLAILSTAKHLREFSLQSTEAQLGLAEDPSLAWLALDIFFVVTDLKMAAAGFGRLAQLVKELRRAAARRAERQLIRKQLEALGSEAEKLAPGLGKQVIADAEADLLRISGAAAVPRVRFRINPNGERRNLQEALQIADRNGIEIDPERFSFTLDNHLPNNLGAEYTRIRGAKPGQIIELESLLDVQGRFVVRLNPNILGSDDMILGVIAHEIHEIKAVEQAFIANGGRLEATQLFNLVDGLKGTAHSAAWDFADEIIERLQRAGRFP